MRHSAKSALPLALLAAIPVATSGTSGLRPRARALCSKSGRVGGCGPLAEHGGRRLLRSATLTWSTLQGQVLSADRWTRGVNRKIRWWRP